MTKPVFSIIAPVYNEEAVLHKLHERIAEVMDGVGEPWELILVNDGSRDKSAEIIAALNAADPRVKGVSFSRNFGFQLAVTAGLDRAQGDAVVLTDADLQDPPEVIPQMIAKWREGFDVVYGVRKSRAGETFVKRLTASAFYRLIDKITGIDIPLDTGDFRLMDRRVVKALTGMKERNRFLRGMVPWVGYRQTGVLYERAARYAGEAHFNSIRRMLPFAIDAITSFSNLPLQLATYLGFFIAMLSAIAILSVVVLRMMTGGELTGQATTLVVVLFLGGVQLISLGIIGEYLGRIYEEVKGRPLYLVQDEWGFAKPEQHSAENPPQQPTSST